MTDVADALLALAEHDEDSAALSARTSTSPKVTFADVAALCDAESVDAPAAIASYLKEPVVEPPPSERASGYVSVQQLRGMLTQARRKRRKHERKEASTEAWKKFMAQPSLPERMKLADLVVALDDKGTDSARALIVAIAREAPFEIGLWGGIKRVWKRAEERHDYALYGALSAAIEQKAGVGVDVGYGTARYVGKRAWRTLRDLGRASPEMFPHVAVEMLRHHDAYGVVVRHVVHLRESDPLAATWKNAPDALLRLLEGARSDWVAKFAIDQLRKHHAETLRTMPASRVARLVESEVALASVHELFLEIVEKSAIPLGSLRANGLHNAALKMLFSPSQKGRAWAAEYARSHAGDLGVDVVVDLVRRGSGEAQKLGVTMLDAIAPAAIALDVMATLLAGAGATVVDKKLRERLATLNESERASFLVECVFMGNAQLKFASTFLLERMKALELWPADVWLRVLDDQRCQWNHASAAYQQLGALNGGDPVAVIEASRILDLVAKRAHDAPTIAAWFDKAQRAQNLDVERAKGLVFPSKTRAFALKVLGNRRLVRPLDLGLPWLLALAKRADPDLHKFAYRTLLEHTAPSDFAPSSTSSERALDAGVSRLFEMATGAAENENTRNFAQTYLRCHHPVIGPHDPQAKELGLKPQLARDAYTVDRTWKALFDPRDDVRRFAAAIAKVELRAWGVQKRLAELCESDDKLVRNVALDAMLKAGDPSADPETTLTLDELDAETIFPLTESTKKSVRDAGMELIRRHYTRLGGVERLSWLMQSAEREVRAFAVRLLWEKHRPRATPSTWKPRALSAERGVEIAFDDAGRFVDADAMRGFLRRVLFALPPGALGPHIDDDTSVRRHVPASVAKKQLVDVVRDIAVADVAFASVVRPVLFEMTGSLAHGEWHACLAAVAAIDASMRARAEVTTATTTAATVKGRGEA